MLLVKTPMLSLKLATLCPSTSIMLCDPRTFRLYTVIDESPSMLKMEVWQLCSLPYEEHASG